MERGKNGNEYKMKRNRKIAPENTKKCLSLYAYLFSKVESLYMNHCNFIFVLKGTQTVTEFHISLTPGTVSILLSYSNDTECL